MEITEGDFRYSIENEKATVIGYFGNDVNLVIPESLGWYGVIDIKIPFSLDYFRAISIKIPNSITNIEEDFFTMCNSLEEIELDEDHPVYSFKDGALFDKTQSIIYAYLPSNKNETYKIPNSVTHIANSAFGCCDNLKNIEIPNSVVRIGDMAFHCCRDLRTIKIPDSVTRIGYMLFCGCSSLTSVKIGNSIETIREKSFSGNNKLTNITISKNHPVYTFVGGILFDKKQISIHTYLSSNEQTLYEIPDFIVSIEDWAFEDCLNLKTIKIPSSVTSIGNWAFEGCHNLETLKIPNSVTSIGLDAFEDCYNLIPTIANGSYAHKYAFENGIKHVLE